MAKAAEKVRLYQQVTSLSDLDILIAARSELIRQYVSRVRQAKKEADPMSYRARFAAAVMAKQEKQIGELQVLIDQLREDEERGI